MLQKVIAAFIAPVIVFIWYSAYTLVTYQGFVFDGILNLSDHLFSTIFIVYIYALPAYLFIAAPISLFIEYCNKGIRWMNYCLAGIVGGFIVLLVYPGNNIDEFRFTTGFVISYMLMGFSFYISLRWVEIKDKKLQKGK